jgi:hypothetical protein
VMLSVDRMVSNGSGNILLRGPIKQDDKQAWSSGEQAQDAQERQ